MQKTILYAILNWGLGHASRSIPIIQYLIRQNYKVIIASDGEALLLLKNEFPNLFFEKVCAYNVTYSKTSSMFKITLARQIPRLIKIIKTEHKDCKILCEKYQVNFIISDNRYGFYHQKVPSALICHQLHLLFKENLLFEKIVNKSYQAFLKNFTQIWVPDFEISSNISGKLSSLKWKNVFYIGVDSRFRNIETSIKNNLLIILSGPEPQRTMLEEILLKQIGEIEGQHTLVRGTQKQPSLSLIKNVKIIDFATSEVLNQKIVESKIVICRSGYTSVIDLLKLRKKALLIPTPGQVEQEYLAKNLANKNWFYSKNQENLNIKIDIEKVIKTQIPELKFAYNFNIIQQFVSFPIY